MKFSRRQFNSLLGAGAVGTAMLPSSGRLLAQSATTKWGTSVLGAGSQVTLAAIISVVAEAEPDLGVQEQITGGPVENARLLGQGALTIAQTTSNVSYNAYHGRGLFEEQGKTPMLGLFAIYPANCSLAVAADSGIESIDDLRGKRIAIGPPAAGITAIMDAWLTAYGIAEEATLVRIGYKEGTDALRSGSVDACLVFGVGGAAVGYLQELDLSMDINVLGWDVDSAGYKQLLEEAPEMAVHGTFAKDLVKNVDQDLTVPTTYSAEYSAPDYPEEDGYLLMKAIWENRDKIAERANLGSWLGRDPGNMLSGLVTDIPVHPGAARFYKEIGGWDDRFTVGTVA